MSLGPRELLDVFLGLRAKIERIVAHRTGSADAAKDLVQDLYLRLDRVSHNVASSEEAQRYLVKMAVNASIDHQRVEGRRLELLEGAVDLFDSHEPDPADAALHADQMRRVDAALAELPEKCREMLYLSRVEGLTHGEIAQRMGVSRSLVEKYVMRAVLHCRARLGQEG